MIVPSEKFVNVVKAYGNQTALCELIGMDNSLFSLLMNRKRGASARVMETVCQKLNLSLSDAWEIIEGDQDD